jgi:hypothetical protein
MCWTCRHGERRDLGKETFSFKKGIGEITS